ncbi:hypothetical protein DERP_014151 [Dermatophagoides pteronyssinus]|uniref:Uncharacterized protein n=1 Tax=Dermatophagoides pteronyssinus TaxID=6956 RepID=A0ABQ8IWG3_DERPT|nr:hypothetical protein DERP_014151 [Dermatophagoides pteronyssinus]
MENPNPTFEDSLQDLTYLMYLLVREPQFFSSRRQFMDAVRRRTSQMRGEEEDDDGDCIK